MIENEGKDVKTEIHRECDDNKADETGQLSDLCGDIFFVTNDKTASVCFDCSSQSTEISHHFCDFCGGHFEISTKSKQHHLITSRNIPKVCTPCYKQMKPEACDVTNHAEQEELRQVVGNAEEGVGRTKRAKELAEQSKHLNFL